MASEWESYLLTRIFHWLCSTLCNMDMFDNVLEEVTVSWRDVTLMMHHWHKQSPVSLETGWSKSDFGLTKPLQEVSLKWSAQVEGKKMSLWNSWMNSEYI